MHGENKRKLTADQVREIRSLRWIEKQTDIAKRMGVTQGTIAAVYSGYSYRDVPYEPVTMPRVSFEQYWNSLSPASQQAVAQHCKARLTYTAV